VGPSPRAERTRTTSRRRRLLVAGLALVACGLAALAWVGWEVVGTTAVAHRHQDRTVAAVQRAWSGGTLTREQRSLSEGVVALVRVPRLGGRWVPAYAGTSDEVLAEGYGVLAGSPGGAGNFAITGHRVTHGQPLADFPALEPGDRVDVRTRTQRLTYELDTAGDALSVSDRATWVASPRPRGAPDDGSLITLVTCAELFHTDERLVVFGHLVDSEPQA
jgi:sortase A